MTFKRALKFNFRVFAQAKLSNTYHTKILLPYHMEKKQLVHQDIYIGIAL